MASVDYVIVGAGSAGCVLAARLSEDPKVHVALLEAGGADDRREIRIPAAFSKLFKSPLDWNYATEPQEHLHGRALYWPRGKVLGGSSSINAMIYIRGNPADYNALGGAGKSWLGVRRSAALFSEVGRSGARAFGAAWRGRAAARRGFADCKSVVACVCRGGDRGRVAGEFGFQWPAAGRRGHLSGDAEARAASKRCGRVSASGAQARESHGGAACSCHADRAGRESRRGHRIC